MMKPPKEAKYRLKNLNRQVDEYRLIVEERGSPEDRIELDQILEKGAQAQRDLGTYREASSMYEYESSWDTATFRYTIPGLKVVAGGREGSKKSFPVRNKLTEEKLQFARDQLKGKAPPYQHGFKSELARKLGIATLGCYLRYRVGRLKLKYQA